MYSSFKKHQLITESWRRFINEDEEESSDIDAVSYIDDLLSGTHASGRPISDTFEPILSEEEETSASELISLLTPEFLESFLKSHANVRTYDTIYIGDVLSNPNLSEIEKAKIIAVYNSIILFTAGSVSTVRDPETYDPDRSSPIKNHRHEKYTIKPSAEEIRFKTNFKYNFPYILQPTKELYLIANHVIYTISTIKNINPDINFIYRGLILPYDIFHNLEVGDVFNSGGPSSWTQTFALGVAYADGEANADEDYSGRSATTKMTKPSAVVLKIQKPQYGNDISAFSQFPGEREFLLGKSVRVMEKSFLARTSATGDNPLYIVHCEIV
jgi:hypothetical protein